MHKQWEIALLIEIHGGDWVPVLSTRLKMCCCLLIFCVNLLDVSYSRMSLALLSKGYLLSHLGSFWIKSNDVSWSCDFTIESEGIWKKIKFFLKIWCSMAVVPNEDACSQSHPLITQCPVVFAWNGSRVGVCKRKTDLWINGSNSIYNWENTFFKITIILVDSGRILMTLSRSNKGLKEISVWRCHRKILVLFHGGEPT